MAANDALIRAYEAQSAFIREKVVAFGLSVWAASHAYRDADVDRIVAQIVPAVQAGQLQLATLTDAYIGRLAQKSGVAWVPSLDRSVTGYRGVDSGVVYRRPAVDVYTALADGEGFSRAVEAGRNRLKSIVSTDLQQARNRQANRSVSQSGFRHYRRVLTGSEDCALCAIASTQMYSSDDLMPIHPGCDCGVEPVLDEAGFASTSQATLLDVHDSIAERLGASELGARDLSLGKTTSSGRKVSDYTDLIVSRNHGELGPTLAWRSQKFTSEAHIAALA